MDQFHADALQLDGLRYECITCRRAYLKSRPVYRLSPEAELRKHLKKTYGLALETYEAMRVVQGGVCALCGRPETVKIHGKVKRLAVDHCHATGRVRGLLCQRCNSFLGKAGDSPAFMRKAADYLSAKDSP